MKKKIVFICSNLNAGGAQNVVTLTSERLVSMGYDVTIITLSSKDSDFYKVSGKVKRISLNKLSNSKNILDAINNNFSRIITLRKTLKSEKYQTCISFVTETNIITIIASLFLKYKIIISERNNPYKQDQKFIWYLLKFLTYPLADILTANSRIAIKYYKKNIFLKKVIYSPNPLPIPQNITYSNGKNFLSVGKLTEQKGHDILIKAFANFIKSNGSYSSYFLTIAGVGKEKSNLQKLALSLGIEKNIFWVYNTNIFELLKKHSVFILSSRYEGTSNALLEAISVAKPIIVSNEASNSINFLKNNHNCIIFPVNDIDLLTRSMEKLINDSNFKSNLSKNLMIDYNIYYSKSDFDSHWIDLVD
ncbi:MAG: GalNAc-alpha-(1-_4)-GalNAc-alpha-(1-_3)-diNAcBac-PP-undecaprenol alpha-1,4-N-acetyl-D-galactosaminyltransferase [Alphaproteobacteria bacterium MarineAlpha2_Bin1]|nr:MAG: GalNAc-alpha-(1->4)-GalNAc-alpha-(1->3)-diNAcBac-PP-undecaprenol alpha-1,4-N-acetyl-D-galactosaminyltransferase [Alphaproteobacteria bacterium MarineAlpha2_Bin1]